MTSRYEALLEDPWATDADRHAALCDQILGQTATLLADGGQVQAVALLLDVESFDIEFGSFESVPEGWDAMAIADVDQHTVERFAGPVMDVIRDALREVAGRFGYGVADIRVRPTLPQIGQDWRDDLSQRLMSPDASNQARRQRAVHEGITEDDLTFGQRRRASRVPGFEEGSGSRFRRGELRDLSVAARAFAPREHVGARLPDHMPQACWTH